MSGFALSMVGAGILAVYSAIKGTSPLEELRSIVTGKRPDPLSSQSRGSPLTEDFAGGDFGGGTGGGKARTVGAQPHVAAEARFIASTWGITADATLVSTGHIPNSDHYRGLAIDAMVGGGVKGGQIGDAIFSHYVSNADSKRVKYVIWKHSIWSQERGSHRYAKNDHMTHVHISFYAIGSSKAQ